MPVKVPGQPEFAYLRQTVRTNNAAVVAEGAAKSTSVYSLTRSEDKPDVVAHLSEGVPRYWFTDNVPSISARLQLREAIAFALSDDSGLCTKRLSKTGRHIPKRL